MIDYFQIKYLISECFYFEVFVNKHSYNQASGICHEAFAEYIKSLKFSITKSQNSFSYKGLSHFYKFFVA